MGRIEIGGAIPSPRQPVELLDRIVALAVQYGIDVVRTSPNQADFRRGSQAALRLKGAMFTRVDQFPVIAVIRCDSTPTGSNVIINSLDDLQVGVRLGMTKKYTEAVRDFGAVLSGIVNEAR
jgi:hypothetical protein